MLSHSIIIPTKDRPGYLPRAVSSALLCLGEGGEVLVVDDASKRAASEVLFPMADEPIRILRREVSLGVSAARNAGVAASRGAVIFFLDDDDEMSPDYVREILSGPALQFDYGFGACSVVIGGRLAKPTRPRFRTGPVPFDAPLRKQLFGTGMGFWIRREVAEAAGPFATEIAMNEDTDYVCRLIQQGRRAWYSARPGVTVHQHHGPRDLPNITSRLDSLERARSMLHVCERFPAMAAHLGRSYLRHCAKAGLRDESTRYLRQQHDLRLRISLSIYFHLKRLGYWISGATRSRS